MMSSHESTTSSFRVDPRTLVVVEPSQLDWFVPGLRSNARRTIGPALRRVTATSELVQETLRIAVERFAEIAGKPVPVVRAWLAETMRRRVLNDLRRAARAPTELEDHDPVDPAPDIPEGLIRTLMHEELREAVAGLPEAEMQVVLGLYHEGVSTRTLAERLGRTTGAIYGLHRRALERLQKNLSEGQP